MSFLSDLFGFPSTDMKLPLCPAQYPQATAAKFADKTAQPTVRVLDSEELHTHIEQAPALYSQMVARQSRANLK